MLVITPLILGPITTNCYLLTDSDSKEAVVVDPAWDGTRIFSEAKKMGIRITQLWYTHAHFDHFGGAAELVRLLEDPPRIALHPADTQLWKAGGGSVSFGMEMYLGPVPDLDLSLQSTLSLGTCLFQVFHAPGHSPGSCLFYNPGENVLFTGDLIFHHSVGRTDLPGGDWAALQESILKKVYTLPGETRILPGHGEETTVGEEKENNPFVPAFGI